MKKGIKNGTVNLHSSVFYIRIFLIKKKDRAAPSRDHSINILLFSSLIYYSATAAESTATLSTVATESVTTVSSITVVSTAVESTAAASLAVLDVQAAKDIANATAKNKTNFFIFFKLNIKQ